MCNRRGFSLTECGLLVVVLGMLVVTVVPGLNKVRSASRGAASAQNLMQIGQSAGSYGFFNRGKLFSYTWRAGESYVLPDGRTKMPRDDFDAAVYQNQEILQRLTGRIDGEFKINSTPGRMPHRRYSHLILIDYLGEDLGSTKYIDPADAHQLQWAANPLDYRVGSSVPYANGPVPAGYDSDPNWPMDSVRQRWPFASSYLAVPSAWQPDYPQPRAIPVPGTPHLFTNAGAVDYHTGRSIHEVAHPANKVWIHEEFDREQAGDPYFGYNRARAEKLMFDGSVNDWASGEANPSVVREYGMFHWRQAYVPLDTFPIPLGGLGDDRLLSQRYRWTFRGLAGFDYGPVVPPRGPTAIENGTIPAARAKGTRGRGDVLGTEDSGLR